MYISCWPAWSWKFPWDVCENYPPPQLFQQVSLGKEMAVLHSWNFTREIFLKFPLEEMDGQCGRGLIISWDKSACLSNGESPLPSIFWLVFCLMQHQLCNWKSEMCCHSWIKSWVEPCMLPKWDIRYTTSSVWASDGSLSLIFFPSKCSHSIADDVLPRAVSMRKPFFFTRCNQTILDFFLLMYSNIVTIQPTQVFSWVLVTVYLFVKWQLWLKQMFGNGNHLRFVPLEAMDIISAASWVHLLIQTLFLFSAATHWCLKYGWTDIVSGLRQHVYLLESGQ